MTTNNIQSSIASGFIAEINGELGVTRKFLERLPDKSLTWKPHEKSMTAGQLALHIAQVPGGVLVMATKDSSEVPDLSHIEQPQTSAQILSALSHTEEQLRTILPTFSDERMHQNLQITKDGVVVMEAPRAGFLRSIMLNHWYHHRGQFGVYLRLLGINVPSAYGPSADEQ